MILHSENEIPPENIAQYELDLSSIDIAQSVYSKVQLLSVFWCVWGVLVVEFDSCRKEGPMIALLLNHSQGIVIISI